MKSIIASKISEVSDLSNSGLNATLSGIIIILHKANTITRMSNFILKGSLTRSINLYFYFYFNCVASPSNFYRLALLFAITYLDTLLLLLTFSPNI